MNCPIASNTPSCRLRPLPAIACVVLFASLLAWVNAAAFAAAPTNSRHAPFPSPEPGYVSDFARVLDPARERQMEQWLTRAEQKTGVQLVVVTINRMADYPDTPRTIEAFATALFNRWQIGNMPRNDGVLLLVSLDDHRARIELGASYGRLRDDDARRIMDKVIIPRFRDGDYADGIEAGVRALLLEFAGVRIGRNWTLIAALVAIPICSLIGYSLITSGQRGWGWVAVGLLLVVIMAVIYLLHRIVRALARSEGDGYWSGGGSLGGGGFGGGFSGGGGATGSW